MASMNFEQKTISDIMSLIDDNTDYFNDSQYIMMCNAMKALHLVLSKMESQQPSQATGATTAPPPSTQQQSTLSSTDVLTQLISMRDRLRTTVSQLENSLRNWPKRLTITDKYTAIIMRFPDLFQISGINETLAISAKVKAMETYVLSNNLITKRDVKKAYDQQKMRRIGEETSSMQNRLMRTRRELSQVNVHIANISYTTTV